MLKRRSRFKAVVLVGIAVVVSLSIGCASESSFSVVQPVPEEPARMVGEGDTVLPQAGSNARPGGAYGFSRYFFEEVGGEVITTLVEGPVGEQVRTDLSYVQLKALYEQGDAPPEELRMTREELGQLVDQLNTVRSSTAKYQDVAQALADGYEVSEEEFPNMGAHFVHLQRLIDGRFNPAEPEFLLYIRSEGGGWELVGTGFILPTQLVGEKHPEAFTGPLDNWHVHYSLCLGGSTNSRSATLDECREQRGEYFPSFGWMIHAYVWEDNPLGVFSMWNPNIPPVVSTDQIKQTRTLKELDEGEVGLITENFSHQSAQIKVGEKLVWTNVDGAPHTVTLGSRGVAEEGFNSGLIGPGQSFSLRFDKPGQYAYTCTLHSYMNGIVTVTQ